MNELNCFQVENGKANANRQGIFFLGAVFQVSKVKHPQAGRISVRFKGRVVISVLILVGGFTILGSSESL